VGVKAANSEAATDHGAAIFGLKKETPGGLEMQKKLLSEVAETVLKKRISFPNLQAKFFIAGPGTGQQPDHPLGLGYALARWGW